MSGVLEASAIVEVKLLSRRIAFERPLDFATSSIKERKSEYHTLLLPITSLFKETVVSRETIVKRLLAKCRQILNVYEAIEKGEIEI